MIEEAGEHFSDIFESRYDIIGFDPRGVGKSGTIRCAPSASDFEFFAKSEPTEPSANASVQEIAYADTYAGLLAAACVNYTGDFIYHVSTENVARDMDMIRDALGEQVTNYWGVSYGTFLGAVYTNLFPEHVGRVILDPSAYSGNLDE